MTPLRLPRSSRAPDGRLSPRDERAAEHLRFIRDTIERAATFTAVSGRGQAVVGLIGLAAGLAAFRVADPRLWLGLWLAVAAVSVAVTAASMVRKARRLRIPLVSGPARRFGLTFVPPLLAGAVLTLVFYRAGFIHRLPGMWLLLFGTAVVGGGAMSVRIVPVMGCCFMAAGVAGLLLPAAWGNVLMAAGFGGLNVVFGLIIAVKHDG